MFYLKIDWNKSDPFFLCSELAAKEKYWEQGTQTSFSKYLTQSFLTHLKVYRFLSWHEKRLLKMLWSSQSSIFGMVWCVIWFPLFLLLLQRPHLWSREGSFCGRNWGQSALYLIFIEGGEIIYFSSSRNIFLYFVFFYYRRLYCDVMFQIK